jgi:hypothetical protein
VCHNARAGCRVPNAPAESPWRRLNGSLESNLALALAVAVCVQATGTVCFAGADRGEGSYSGSSRSVVYLGVGVEWNGGQQPQRLSPSCRLSRLALQQPWAIIFGKTAALDALASGPHGASGLREHVKYLLLPPILSPPRMAIRFLFTVTLACSRSRASKEQETLACLIRSLLLLGCCMPTSHHEAQRTTTLLPLIRPPPGLQSLFALHASPYVTQRCLRAGGNSFECVLHFRYQP